MPFGIVSAIFIMMTLGQLSFAATASPTGNATLEKYFNACYTTVMKTEGLTIPTMAVMAKVIPANKVESSYKAQVIQNMTQPIHLKPIFQGANMAFEEATISQIAQCMVRLQS